MKSVLNGAVAATNRFNLIFIFIYLWRRVRTEEKSVGFQTACIPWWVRLGRSRCTRRPAPQCWHGNQSASSGWSRAAARRGETAEHRLQRIIISLRPSTNEINGSLSPSDVHILGNKMWLIRYERNAQRRRSHQLSPPHENKQKINEKELIH